MRFTASTVLALVAMSAPVLAQTPGFDGVNSPAPYQELATGQSFDIQWDVPAEYKGVTVNIQIIGGETQSTQVVLGPVVSGIPNSQGHYTWVVDAKYFGQKVYGFIISDAANPNTYQYSNPFKMVAGASQASSSAPASAVATGSTTTVQLSSVAPTAAASSAASSVATGGETLVVIDITTTVPCETSTPAAAATTAAAVPTTVAQVAVPPAAESSPAGAAPAEPSPVTVALPVASGVSTGVFPQTTLTSAVWTAPANPPVPTSGIPTTSGAARIGGSLAVIAGLITAFLAL